VEGRGIEPLLVHPMCAVSIRYIVVMGGPVPSIIKERVSVHLAIQQYTKDHS